MGVVTLGVVLSGDSISEAFISVIATTGVGIGAGVVGALVILASLRLFNMNEILRAPLALAAAVGAYTVANLLVPEAGLYATTVVGIILANQSSCLLYTSPSPRDRQKSRMPSSA